MPPKISELIRRLEGVGYKNRGGKGSHRNFLHPSASNPITISGKLSDDAKPYQIKAVQEAIHEVTK